MNFNKIKYVFLVFMLLAIFTAGCSNNTNNITEEKVDDASYYSFIDALGNEVVLTDKPKRVVSLVGSYAETWTLAGGSLVGVTDDVETENRMKFTDDIQVVGTIKEPNVEEVLALNPDFVLLSPDVDSHLKIVEILGKTKISYGFFKVEKFEDYLEMLKICTDITGRKDLYEENGIKVEKDIKDTLSKIDSTKEEKPAVLFVRAFSSGAKAKKDDNMTCTMLEELGTINIAAKHPSLLEDLSIEEIIEEDPDFIFVTTMGDEQKAIKGLKSGIETNPAWSNLSAVKNDRYILLPKELFHYKPNNRWGESYEYLAKIIYPEIFE